MSAALRGGSPSHARAARRTFTASGTRTRSSAGSGRSQAGGQLGEQVVCGRHRAPAVRRQQRHRAGGGGEVGVDAVEHHLARGASRPEPEIVAAERRLVVDEVTQEVHVLKRRAEAPCPVGEFG